MEKIKSPRHLLLVEIHEINTRLDAQLKQTVPYLKGFVEQTDLTDNEELVTLNKLIGQLEERYRTIYKPKAFKLNKPYLVKRHTEAIDKLIRDTKKINKELKQSLVRGELFNINQDIVGTLEEKINLVKDTGNCWYRISKLLNT